MKTIFEVIESCKNGETSTVDEMRFTICCMDALSTFDAMAFRRLAKAQKEGSKLILTSSPEWQCDENFYRWKRALQVEPLKYLGENNNPDNPEVQKRRKVSIKLFNKIMERSEITAEDDKEDNDGIRVRS